MSVPGIAYSMPPASLFDIGEVTRRWTRMRRDIAIEQKFASMKLADAVELASPDAGGLDEMPAWRERRMRRDMMREALHDRRRD
jgi:hypothetical protein